MMEDKKGQDEWELSKENVQPLRNGRKFANLSMALQPNTGDQMDKLKQGIQEFEAQLRTYRGDDPLDVWIRYIDWTEQNFPTGGKESNLSQILAQCVSKFKDEEKYKNDTRYLNVWIKFAMQCSEPLEIFSFLFNQKIGSKLSDFYIAWAWELEQVGNFKKADTIYSQGDEVGAQPLELLRRRHSEFQARVAKHTVSGSSQSEDPPPVQQQQQQRLALGVLKGKGKTAVAPVDRSGTSRSALRGGLNLGTDPLGSNQQNNQQFSVFTDENATSALPPQSGEYAHIPGNKIHGENTQKPGTWKNAKVKQKSVPAVQISEVSHQANPTFSVFHDEGEEQSLKTPKKVNVDFNNQVLSVKKPSKTEDPFYHIQHMPQQAQDPNQKPMYCKAMVYNGCKEFSFDELRALEWKKNKDRIQKMQEKEELLEQKARELEEREQLLHQQRQELQEKQKQLEMKTETVEVYQDKGLCLTQNKLKPLTRSNSGGRLQAANVHCGRYNHLNQSQTTTPQNESSSLSCSQITSSGGSTSGYTNPEHFKSVQGRQLTPLNQSELLNSKDSADGQQSSSFGFQKNQKGKLIGAQALGGNSLNVTTNQTPSFNHSLSSAPGSGIQKKLSSKITPDSSFMRSSSGTTATPRSGGLTAPSPTVNTKEAMHLVMGMFNRTLDIGNNFGWEQTEQANDFEADFAETHQEPPAAAAPFQIYTEPSNDNQTTQKPQSFSQAKQPGPAFTVFTDDPSTEPMDTQQKKSILVQDCPGNKMQDIGDKEKSVLPQHRAPLSALSGLTSAAPASALSDSGMSSVVHHLPMPSETENEVTEMVNAGNIYNKQSQDPDMMDDDFDGNDLTFMPKFSSTINFTQAAHLASTPFNALGEMAPFMAPPVSVIKSRLAEDVGSAPVASATMMSENAVQEQTVLTEPQAVVSGNVTSSGDSSQPVSMEASRPVGEGTEQDSSVPLQGRRSSAFVGNTANLSPIMEQSDEDPKSQGSSLGNNSTAHSNVFAANSTHHISHSTVQSKENHTIHLPSVDEEPSKLSHSVMDASHLTEKSVAPPTANLEVSMRKACRPLEGVGNLTMHEIDITNYVPAESDDRTEKLLNMSVAIEDNDPFDEKVISRFLSQLKKPLESYENYHIMNENMPVIQLGKAFALGENIYNFESVMGEGAYAKVYKANLLFETEYDLENEEKVIKVQNPPCPWEFYVTSELYQRLSALNMNYDVRPSVMHVDHCYLYTDGSCLVSDLHKHGTLLDLVNLHTRTNKKIPQQLVILIAIEMLHLAEQLQKANIIHGDIKPDNFLITGIPDIADNTTIDDLIGGHSKFIKLIDFGRSIDLTMYPKGTTFTAKVDTSGFQCIEMNTDRPWTYQTDLFGIIGSLHVLLFRDYMKVYQERGRWRIIQGFRRYHLGMDSWKKLFDTCLNIPSCDELPDIVGLRLEFEALLKAELNHWRNFKTFVNTLKDLSIMYWEA